MLDNKKEKYNLRLTEMERKHVILALENYVGERWSWKNEMNIIKFLKSLEDKFELRGDDNK